MSWKRTWSLVVLGFVALVMSPVPSFAQDLGICGSLNNSFGPFDYRYKTSVKTELGDAHSMVEGAHFTPQIEQLIRGKTAVEPGPDIDYTLRAFPNPITEHSCRCHGLRYVPSRTSLRECDTQ